MRTKVDPVQWFLNERDDTRSSFYLEDAATEFQVQGLELDWTCVTWDADLRCSASQWLHRKFHGSRWKHVKNLDHQRHLVNAYRVLLTRARQGMVIFVPPGDIADPTRLPEFYDGTYEYLVALGVESI
ncbi:MAG: DNA/RNA helicase domain-containing protein [Planctomycetota bacterium]